MHVRCNSKACLSDLKDFSNPDVCFLSLTIRNYQQQLHGHILNGKRLHVRWVAVYPSVPLGAQCGPGQGLAHPCSSTPTPGRQACAPLPLCTRVSDLVVPVCRYSLHVYSHPMHTVLHAPPSIATQPPSSPLPLPDHLYEWPECVLAPPRLTLPSSHLVQSANAYCVT